MSVWESVAHLFEFTFHSDHLTIFKRKKEWFHNMKVRHFVMWYIEEGHLPDLMEAKDRLNHLNEHGETPYAFTFRKKFTIIDWLAWQAK